MVYLTNRIEQRDGIHAARCGRCCEPINVSGVVRTVQTSAMPAPGFYYYHAACSPSHIDRHPSGEWSDLEWEAWWEFRRINRDRLREAKRREYAATMSAGKYLIERNGDHVTVWPNAWQKSIDSGSRTLDDVARHVESRENGFGWTVAISDHVPYRYRPGLSPIGAAEYLRLRGYTHMMTLGGPVPLDDWTPYGEAGATVRFRWDETAGRLHELPEPTDSAPFVRGVWEPVRVV